MSMSIITLPDRFWAKVDKTEGQGPNGDCWTWTGSKNERGYGNMEIDGKRKPVGAIAWFLETGEWPAWRIEVCHECDFPPCVRFGHLFLGTHTQNIHDMMTKGRHRCDPPRGEAAGQAKLTEIQVHEIRRLLAAGVSLSELGRRFNVHHVTIRQIRLRKTWSHI